VLDGEAACRKETRRGGGQRFVGLETGEKKRKVGH